MSSLRWGSASVISILVWAGPLLAQQKGPDAPPPGPNVEITIAIGETDADTALRTYKMLTRDGAAPGELLMGWRVPIPSSRSGEQNEITYVYQNVGVTVRLQPVLLSDGKILVHGEVEASGSKEGPASLQRTEDLPIVATFQQSVDVILTEGRALRVAEVPDPEGGRLYLDLTARVLR